MRADRLISILLLMQSRERVTAADLAGELGVSLATTRRDLEALALAGVPVYAQPGRNGGWSLVGGAKTDLSGLTSHEANALFLLLGPTASANETTLSALRKLLHALPATFREEASRAAQATMIDRAMWDHRSHPEPPMLEATRTAIVQRRQMVIGYANRSGVASRRTIHPLGTIEKDGIWYLIASTDSGNRTFRLDRMQSAVITDEPAHVPPDFDLATAWEATVNEVERKRATTTAQLRIAIRHLPVLRDHFGTQLQLIDDTPDQDDRIAVTVSAPAPFMLASQLAGWGNTIEVIGPETVRAELVRIGQELIAGNAPPADDK